MSTALDVRLKAKYKSDIAPALKTQFGYKNVMQIPNLTKIVVNMGVGDAARDSKLIEGAIRDLATITGQKPQVTKSRKSIAQFKLREGQPIGAHVTMRGDRILVEGVNRQKRHTKESTGDRGVKVGGIITIEAAIHISNVMVADSDGKATRLGSRSNDEGKNVRISRRTGKDI